MDYPRLDGCGMLYDQPGVGFPGSCGEDNKHWHDVDGTDVYAQNTVGFWVGIVEDIDALQAGDIKLRSGDGISFGIAMYWNGLQYNTVCGDDDHANSQVADVICRSLGYVNGGSFCHSPSYSSSDNHCSFDWIDTLPDIAVDGRYCTGTET